MLHSDARIFTSCMRLVLFEAPAVPLIGSHHEYPDYSAVEWYLISVKPSQSPSETATTVRRYSRQV
jgi:hypothetical protein